MDFLGNSLEQTWKICLENQFEYSEIFCSWKKFQEITWNVYSWVCCFIIHETLKNIHGKEMSKFDIEDTCLIFSYHIHILVLRLSHNNL